MKVCVESGCPELTTSTRCTAHARAKDKARGTRQQRGYGKDHEAERARWTPLVATGNVKCWRCGDYIEAGAAWDLGHDDQDRSKYRGPEHVGCNRATSGRTACEVTVVCGPPCSGKSTWVREQMQRGDLVVDYDDIAQRLGSPRSHNHHPKFYKRVEATIARALDGIRRGRHERAWVIRSNLARAQALADDLGARLVVIDEPDAVLIERAAKRPDPSATIRGIREWRQAHGISPRA